MKLRLNMLNMAIDYNIVLLLLQLLTIIISNDCIYIAILKTTFNIKSLILSAYITVPALPPRSH